MSRTITGRVSEVAILGGHRTFDIMEDIERLFAGNGLLRSRSIRCSLEQGVLNLSGQVPTYYLKQLVQEAFRAVEGVEVIVNNLRVELTASD